MRPLLYPSIPAARNRLARSISSLQTGHLLHGAKWDYRIVAAIEGDNTRIRCLQAKVINQREIVFDSPQWFVLLYRPCSSSETKKTTGHLRRAVIKRAPPADETATENLDRERRIYLLPGVASATCFRKMWDVIDSRTIALEWMDTTLAATRYQPDMRNYAILKVVLTETLTSCDLLDGQQHVNTGTASCTRTRRVGSR